QRQVKQILLWRAIDCCNRSESENRGIYKVNFSFEYNLYKFKQKLNKMIQIYHNPRCSKSREGLSILEESGKDFEVIPYMQESLNAEDLKKIILTLGMDPIDLVRKNEAVWKENYRDKILTDDQIIEAMVEHPQLIERPVVVNGNRAVIG